MNRDLELIDTHVHLDATPQPLSALEAARAAGVSGFVVPGVHASGWPALCRLAAEHAGVFAAPGLHPQAAADWSPARERQLAALLETPEVVAVGEIGLDRLLDAPDFTLQKEAFRAQLRLAVANGKPVLIHCRKAYGELLAILIEERAERVGGILHAYGGSLETARTAVDLGFAIAFGGPLTWPGARRAPQVLAGLPAEALVLESDAPDLAPHPHRGEENRPAWLPLVAEAMAAVRGWSLVETARITRNNARRVLSLPDASGPLEG